MILVERFVLLMWHLRKLVTRARFHTRLGGALDPGARAAALRAWPSAEQ